MVGVFIYDNIIMKKYWVIFDMDGVISDTQKYHGEVELEILSQYGITTIAPNSDETITIDRIWQNFAGVQPKERMKILFDLHNIWNQFDIHSIEKKKNDLLFYKYNNRASIEFINGAKELIEVLAKKEKYILTVVTASTRECMLKVLDSLWLINKFNELVSIYDTDPNTNKPYSSKWDPEVYETIINKYELDNFVMIEDGATGMNGAIKAGWKAIAVLWENNADKFAQAVSHHKDLSTISIEEIKSILKL